MITTASLPSVLFSFQGRLPRLPYFLISLVSGALAYAAQRLLEAPEPNILLALPVALFSFWVGLAVSFKRIHDIGKTAWLLLLMLVPLVNFIFGLYMTFAPGEPGSNRFGPPPGMPEPQGDLPPSMTV